MTKSSLSHFAMSRAYYQDDLTWCIKRAPFYSHMVNAFFLADPECWILIIFGVGYVSGFLLYFGIPFDLEYDRRNQHDWHYTTLLIMLPLVIGVNQRYQPKFFALRLIYFVISLACIAHWQIFLFKLVRFVKIPIRHPQIATIDEIVERGFRLAGSEDVLSLISFDQRVCFNCIDLNRSGILNQNFRSLFSV